MTDQLVVGYVFALIFFFLQYQIVTKSLEINEKIFLVFKEIYPPQNLFKRVTFSICKLQIWADLNGPVAFDKALKFTLSENLFTARIMSCRCTRTVSPDTVIRHEIECSIFRETCQELAWLSTAHSEIVFTEVYSARSAAASFLLLVT